MAKLRNIAGRVRHPDASSELQVHPAQSQACDGPPPPYQTIRGGGVAC